MNSVMTSGKSPAVVSAVQRGLEPGYAEDKWGPWKSHKLLLSEVMASVPGWANRYGMSTFITASHVF